MMENKYMDSWEPDGEWTMQGGSREKESEIKIKMGKDTETF